MDKDFKRLTNFLVEMGVDEIPHTHKSYLANFIAVFRSWNPRAARRTCAGRECSTRSTAREGFRAFFAP